MADRGRAANSESIVCIAGHRLGDDDTSSVDGRSVGSFDSGFSPCSLRSKPKGEGGDLCCARIDVHAVQVVLDYQRRQSAIKVFSGRERLTQ